MEDDDVDTSSSLRKKHHCNISERTNDIFCDVEDPDSYIFQTPRRTQSKWAASRSENFYASREDEDIGYCLNKIMDLENKLSDFCDTIENVQKTVEDSRQSSFFCEAKTRCFENQLKEIGNQAGEKHELDRQQLREMIMKHEKRSNKEIEKYANAIVSLREECTEIKEDVDHAKAIAARSEDIEKNTEKMIKENTLEVKRLKDEIIDLRDIVVSGIETAARDSKTILQALQRLHDPLEELKQKNELRNASIIEEDASNCCKCKVLEDKLKIMTEQCDEALESNEELYAKLLIKGAHEGKILLESEHQSLAFEIENHSKDELIRILTEEKKLNMEMRDYIERILLNVMEHYPCLLEVKQRKKL